MPPLSTVSRKKIKLTSYSKIGILGDSIAAQRSGAIILALFGIGYNVSQKLYAVSGTKIQDQSAKIPEMVSDGVTDCFIQVGTNNTSDSDLGLIYLKYETLIKDLRTAGIEPHFCMVPPKSGSTDSISVAKINTALYMACRVHYVELFAVWYDYFMATGGWSAPTTSNDNVHPAMSTRVSAGGVLSNLIKTSQILKLVANTNYDGILANPCFVTDSNADGTADSWDSTVNDAVTYSIVSDGTNGHKKQRISLANSSNGQAGKITQTVPVSQGSKVRLSAILDMTVSDDTLDSQVWGRVMLDWYDSSYGLIRTDTYGNHLISGKNIVDFIAVAPANTAYVRVNFFLFCGNGLSYSGTVTMDISRVLLQNLSALGIP